MQDNRGSLDRLVQRYTSRKLLVWLASTVFLIIGDVSGDQWVTITLAYVGTQAFVDAAVAWKHGK